MVNMAWQLSPEEGRSARLRYTMTIARSEGRTIRETEEKIKVSNPGPKRCHTCTCKSDDHEVLTPD